jgi:formylglycine-generating enzyme required for sulfatase activity
MLTSPRFGDDMTEPLRYAAFISYSSKDARFARRLHRALERYGIPTALGKFQLLQGGKRNRIYPVFRDREELPAGNLGELLEANLRASASLVVICSTNSATSPWVQGEIAYFAGLGRRDRVFAIIADSAPLYDTDGNDATPGLFPPAFRPGTSGEASLLEPLAADARKGKDGFRNAWLKIVAGMLGISPGKLADRDKAVRRGRLMRSATAAVLLAAGLGYAYSQRDTIEEFAISRLKFRQFLDTNASLGAAAAGFEFQDCRDGSTDCPVMVVVPSGRFLMGELEEYRRPDAAPLPEIAIRRFAVSQYEVTYAEWQACLDNGGCNGYVPSREEGAGDANPVAYVHLADAEAYVSWLSRMTGETYRLLTESEWEYAARARTALKAPRTYYHWGNEDPHCDPAARTGASFTDCEDKHWGSWPVGTFKPNAFGLYDMHGNIGEWVEDCLRKPNEKPPADGSAFKDKACSGRIARGGTWLSQSKGIGSSIRVPILYAVRNPQYGFRVARTIVAELGAQSSHE